jgi:hypothetical protein
MDLQLASSLPRLNKVSCSFDHETAGYKDSNPQPDARVVSAGAVPAKKRNAQSNKRSKGTVHNFDTYPLGESLAAEAHRSGPHDSKAPVEQSPGDGRSNTSPGIARELSSDSSHASSQASTQRSCACFSILTEDTEADWDDYDDSVSLEKSGDYILALIDEIHGARVTCPECKISYSQKFAPIVSSTEGLHDEVKAFDDPETNFFTAAVDLANPVEVGRAYVNLARLQVRFAIGVYLERLHRLDVEEGVAHSGLHHSKALRKMYPKVSEGISKAIYSGVFILSSLTIEVVDSFVPDLGAIAGANMASEFALLQAAKVDLSLIDSPEAFARLDAAAATNFDVRRFLPHQVSCLPSRSNSPSLSANRHEVSVQ